MKRSTLEGTQIILLDDNLYKLPKIHLQIFTALVSYENLFPNTGNAENLTHLVFNLGNYYSIGKGLKNCG
jgi:hypothetical protein